MGLALAACASPAHGQASGPPDAADPGAQDPGAQDPAGLDHAGLDPAGLDHGAQGSTAQGSTRRVPTERGPVDGDALEELETRLESLEQRLGVDVDDERLPDRAWIVPGTDWTLRVGGYVKLDLIHDLYAIEDEFKFATKSIAVPERREPRTVFNARATRIHIDSRGTLRGRDARLFVEADFFGPGDALRLRHAFGQVDGFLAGQTWSTFADLSTRPRTLDFEGPDAEVFLRRPQLRYTARPRPGLELRAALEQSTSDVSALPGVSGEGTSAAPDLVVTARLEGEHAHLQVGALAGLLRFEGEGGTPDDTDGRFGLTASGRVRLGPRDDWMGQLVVGEGSAFASQAFRGTGSDAVVTADGELRTLRSWAAYMGWEHAWSERWSSTFVASHAEVDPRAFQPADTLLRSNSASANLVWRPTEDLRLGLELLYGRRTDLDERTGHALRAQLSVQFFF